MSFRLNINKKHLKPGTGRVKMDKVIEKWDEILQIVKVEYDVANVAFNTWLKPLKVYEVRDNVVTILVPSEQSVLLDIVNKNTDCLFRLQSARLREWKAVKSYRALYNKLLQTAS